MIENARVMRRLRWWLRSREMDREMSEEMRFHVEMEAAELETGGVSREEAWRRAQVAFGGVDRFGEEGREARGFVLVRELISDVRYAVRALARTPAFTLVALSALGIAIGANAAIFGYVDAAAFRPLSVPQADRLVGVYSQQGDDELGEWSWLAYRDLAEHAAGFVGLAAFSESPISVGDAAGADVVWSAMVSPNYFATLGVRALHGRVLGEADAEQPVIVLGHSAWKNRFGADPTVIGRAVQLNGYTWTVVGVLPASYSGTRLFSYEPGVWLPAGMHAQARPSSHALLRSRGWNAFHVVGRMAEGVTRDEAAASLNAVAVRLAADHPEHEDLRVQLVDNSTAINPWLAPPEKLRAIGLMTLAGVGLVLLIACADVANLLLARMTTRRREIAIRLSLGASRARLFRQFLTESLVLSALGCVVAVPLALLAIGATDALTPPLDFATAYHPMFDVRVMLFSAAVALAAGVVFGLAPAVQALRPGVAATLRDEGSATTLRRGRLRDALVIAQVATSVIVLVSAGLFAKGLNRAKSIDPGFRADGAFVFTLNPELARTYDAARITQMYDELMSGLEALPGVTAVARSSNVPLTGSNSGTRGFAEGGGASLEDAVAFDYQVIDGDYSGALGVRLLAGRMFMPQDGDREVEPIVINEALADALWPGVSPLGRRMRVGEADGDVTEVVGVIATAKSRTIGESPRPHVLFSADRNIVSNMTLVVRTTLDPASYYDAARRVIADVDPSLPVVGMKTLEQHIAVSYSAVSSGATTSTFFGILALLLAASGIYGVLSYVVAQRAREFGIRMALGAEAGQVLALVLGRGLRLTLIGIVAGVLLALPAVRALGGLLYGVSPFDPVVFAGVTALLLTVALVATFLPAWRATRIQPMRALRTD